MLANLLDVIIRSLVSVTLLFSLARLMGKKQIAQLTFFDYIVGISIGSIAAGFAIDSTISYTHGIAALIIYALFPIITSFISRKSIKGRTILGGTPTVLIQNGKLVENNLRKTKFQVNEILEECRMKGAFSLSDVEYALLETSGKVSIMLNPQKQSVTTADLHISVPAKTLAAELIIDGQILNRHLNLIGKDQSWLMTELSKQNIISPQDVLLAYLDTDGSFHVDRKNSDPVPFEVLK